MITTLKTRTRISLTTIGVTLALIGTLLVVNANNADAIEFAQNDGALIACDADRNLQLWGQGVIGTRPNVIGSGDVNPVDETAYTGFVVYRWSGSSWVSQGFTGWDSHDLTTDVQYGYHTDVVDEGYYAAFSYVAHLPDGGTWQYDSDLATLQGIPGTGYYTYCG